MKLYDGADLDFNAALKYGKGETEKSAKGKIETTCSELTRIAKSILEYMQKISPVKYFVLSALQAIFIDPCAVRHKYDNSLGVCITNASLAIFSNCSKGKCLQILLTAIEKPPNRLYFDLLN